MDKIIESYLLSKGFSRYCYNGGVRYNWGNYDLEVYENEDDVTEYCIYYKSMSGTPTIDFYEVLRGLLGTEEEFKLFVRSQRIKNVLKT